jgi:tetratricopeptide (TPR) repeat protein
MARLSLQTKAVEISLGVDRPSEAPAHLAQARLLLDTGRVEEAFQQADRALSLGADDVMTWDILSGALEALGEMALAAAARERALSFDPDRADLHAGLGRLYEALDRPFDAAARYQRALELDASLVEAHVALSGLFGRAGQFARARTYAEAALALARQAADHHARCAPATPCADARKRGSRQLARALFGSTRPL